MTRNRYQLTRCRCEDCQDIPDSQLQCHHLFSNSKINRKKYGKLIENNINKILISEKHHLWKAIPSLTESEFCIAVGCEPNSKLDSVWETYNYLLYCEEEE